MVPQPPRERGPFPQRSPCPLGTFAELSRRLRRRRQRRHFLRSAVTVTTVVAAGGGLAWLFGSHGSRETEAGGIPCTEVLSLAAAYAKGELSASVREQVRRHIAWCPQCGPKFRAMGLAT